MELRAILLESQYLQLEPLENAHREELRGAANDERIWQHFSFIARGAGFDTWFDQLLELKERCEQIPFAVRRKSDHALIGSTSYLDVVLRHRRLEIDATWCVPEVWSTRINPECKLLLLTYAFEVIGVNRVALLTDVRNERSQAAIAKLGATREGVLRSHMITQGERIRDSVLFSIIASDWKQVKANLTLRLADQQP